MSAHTAVVEWSNPSPDYLKGRYSRAHTWRFDGGAEVPASASPSVVPLPLSDAAGVDPEEAFIAALSSCHMLTFLDLARRKGFTITHYRDEAVGQLTKREDGTMWVSTVTLRPAITYGGDKRPTADEAHDLHEAAHKMCFISNSVKTEVSVEDREN